MEPTILVCFLAGFFGQLAVVAVKLRPILLVVDRVLMRFLPGEATLDSYLAL